ncbi:MAG: hypothetical protein Ta2B_02340 [Termitinemataceae bacterium]|nr:MAG: hypothetical protein Ta2B_02340 [Termitinemataceae bacterium]
MANETIFLVDDNAANLTMGKSVLSENYKTFTIPSAQKMFELLAKIKPDLILLDVLMPEMSGFEAIKILKDGLDCNIPVVFLTADNDVQSEKEGLALGAVDYIHKPFNCEELLQRIEKCLLPQNKLNI